MDSAQKDKREQHIGILGGTFDPIHYGHLRIALECMQTYSLDHVRFIPCKNPVHRVEPEASAEHRLRMVNLALSNQMGFIVDDIEYRLGGPSYMHTTLKTLRDQFATNTRFYLILGMDAFSEFHHWFRYEEIFDLAHIIIATRPSMPPTTDANLLELLEHRLISEPGEFCSRSTGLIAQCPVTRLDISARHLRYLFSQRKSGRYLCPDLVLSYVEEMGLYRV